MHNSSVKCSRVIYFSPDVRLPGVWSRNIFSSNNPNDSQIACLSLVKNLLMMRVEGAPCLLVADDSPVYEGKQRENIIMFPPNHSFSWNPTTLEHLNKPPSLRIARISCLTAFLICQVIIHYNNHYISIFKHYLHICADWKSIGKKIGHDRYMSRSTGVFVKLLHRCNKEAVPSLCTPPPFIL